MDKGREKEHPHMDQILMHYLQVSQHMSQQFRNHFGKLNLTFP